MRCSGKTRRKLNKAGELSAAELMYCELKAKDNDDGRAFDAAFPGLKITEAARRKRIFRLNRKPLVAGRIREIRERFARREGDRYDGLKERLVDKMVEGVEAITADDPREVARCVGLIRQISAMMGYESGATVTLRNGGVSPDYIPPESIRNLTVEQARRLCGGEGREGAGHQG